MARSRSAKDKGSSGDKSEPANKVPATAGAGGSGGGGRRRPSGSSSSPRPQQQRRRVEKAGSVTKGVQRGRTSRFLSEVIAELKKVSWPDRKTLLQSTAVVLVVVAIVAAYLAILDNAFERLVDVIF